MATNNPRHGYHRKRSHVKPRLWTLRCWHTPAIIAACRRMPRMKLTRSLNFVCEV
jgi:hypothetical protein